MTILTILEYPDPRLRTVAKPVEQVDDNVRTLVDDLFETMYDAPGIGLAASQVDVHKRIIVIDVSQERDTPHVFINPVLEGLGEEAPVEEGCLSIPGYYEQVIRYEAVKVEALNRSGETFSMTATDMLAVCIQHECDHLEGKLFVDYISPLKRNRIRRKLTKAKRARA
ncbi:MAG: peptide deformylase [Proteobacteria bacterium]|nr:peptide deformylase [Pseudomonadota bacterium]